jgi:hypothetical protein
MVVSTLEVPGRIKVIPIRYGYFDAFRFWFPFWTRNQPVKLVYQQIRVALQKHRMAYPEAKLSIIAHSFGTYVIGKILAREFDIRIHRLILCGSVLPLNFSWEQYRGRFDDDNSINECGKADIWPVLAQSASWGYGASGTHGFSNETLIINRFHEGGHGQYFKQEFVEKYWEPFIRRGEHERTEYEKGMRTTPWWLSILGITHLQWLLTLLIVGTLGFAIKSVVTAGRGVADAGGPNQPATIAVKPPDDRDTPTPRNGNGPPGPSESQASGGDGPVTTQPEPVPPPGPKPVAGTPAVDDQIRTLWVAEEPNKTKFIRQEDGTWLSSDDGGGLLPKNWSSQ